MATAENLKHDQTILEYKENVFHIDKFYSLHMKTLHNTESKCEEVQNVTLTRQFFRIEILGILHDFVIISFC